MLTFLSASENTGFVAALGLLVLIGAVEAIGLGVGGIDADIDGDAGWLGWLGIGRLPFMVLLVLFLATFALVGLAGQGIAAGLLGHLLPSWAALPASAAVALPLTGGLARPLARILPRDETTAVGVDVLVGRHAEIVVGVARAGSPARARLHDHHGQSHYVMVEPATSGQSFAEGDEVLLVSRDRNVFHAIASDRPAFSKWIAS